MATASGGKNFLLEKGEKIGLGVAVGFGVLFIALGVMDLAGGAESPADFAKNVDGKASALKSAMDSPIATIPEISGDINKQVSSTPVALAETKLPYYDPTMPPDGRRINPVVLNMAEGQADIAVLKILANDFVLERDSEGNVTKVTVGVVTAKDTNAKLEGSSDFLKDVRKKFRPGQLPGRKKQNPSGGGPGMPGGPGGPGMPSGPGGPGLGAGGPGLGAGGPGGPAGPGGSQGPPPMGGSGSFQGSGGSSLGPTPGGGGPRDGNLTGSGGMFTGSQTAGNRMHVEYIDGSNDEEIEKKLEGRRLAITIKPQRMAVLQGSFPYRQLAKFQQALRYSKVEDLYNRPEDMPTFNGVDVQRRLYRKKSVGSSELEMIEDWTSLDLAANSQDLRAVKLYYDEEPAELRRVMLHEDHLLVMPLPHAIAGKYPDLRLPTLKDSIAKMKKQDSKTPALPPPQNKYMGDKNPFKRDNGANASLYNPGEGGQSFMPKPGGGKDKGENTAANAAIEPPEHIFVRVYDTDIKDGLVHEYRMRVKVKNPNYNKHTMVSKQSDADNEELPPLEEHWYVFPDKVSVPQGGYHYITDPVPPGKSAYPMPQPRDGQAVMQFQRWYEYLDISERNKEPIGDWVQSELLITRGQYVSGKAFAPLPFWSSVDNAFVLREIPGEKAVKGKEPRKGVVLEPIRPRYLLTVDVAGGKTYTAIAPNPGERTNRSPRTQDEAAAEVLFMYPDGTLEMRSSARDKGDPERKTREENFNKWKAETEGKSPSLDPKKDKSDF